MTTIRVRTAPGAEPGGPPVLLQSRVIYPSYPSRLLVPGAIHRALREVPAAHQPCGRRHPPPAAPHREERCRVIFRHASSETSFS
jgi:hypothetical protein